MSKQARIKPEMLRSYWTVEAMDFANRLIQRKRHRRLGENGIKELKCHAWLSDFRWKYLSNRIIRPEFVPKEKSGNFIQKHVNKERVETNPEYSKMLKKSSFQELFRDYFYRECPGQRVKENFPLITPKNYRRG